VDSGGPDTPAPTCDVSHPFGTPVPVPGLNATGNDAGARLMPDELTVYFQSDRSGDRDIYMATRATRTAAFGTPQLVGGVNSVGSDAWPSPTGDGLMLFFETMRTGPNQVFVATRNTILAQFSGAAGVVNVSQGVESGQPYVIPSGRALYLFIGADLFRAELGANAQFETPVAVSTINTPSVEYFATPTGDELTLYFASNRTDAPAKGNFDIWMARRASSTAAFDPPVNVQELNTANEEFPSWISPDNCRLYFSRGDAAGEKIFMAERAP